MALLDPVMPCAPSSFTPSLFGADILRIEAETITNRSGYVPAELRYTQPAIEVRNARFCNVTVSYTHPGQDDYITVETWLPETWNGLFQGMGGGGFSAGRGSYSYYPMLAAVAEGFATAATDAGLANSTVTETPWALLSPGNVHLYGLQNFASVSLHDKTVIAKSLIKSFYGMPPRYSYFNACSTGGRQGIMLAQRYPDAYDGIAAAAPALYWTELAASWFWPYQFMENMGVFPHECEIDTITAAAITMCDPRDGVADGIISDPKDCLSHFDPSSQVGRKVSCESVEGGSVVITPEAAAVVGAVWQGTQDRDGRPASPGLGPGADLTGNVLPKSVLAGVVDTNCSGGYGTCRGNPFVIGMTWMQDFAARDRDRDLRHLNQTEFDLLWYGAQQRYGSLINSADADLRAFRDAGGKMMTYHGLDDQLVPPASTERYYQAVAAVDPQVDDFYRYFEVPGLSHCSEGRSGNPTGMFAQLRAWVENGTVPDLSRVDVVTRPEGDTHHRIICPYPQKPRMTECRDAADAACWSCVGQLSGGDSSPFKAYNPPYEL